MKNRVKMMTEKLNSQSQIQKRKSMDTNSDRTTNQTLPKEIDLSAYNRLDLSFTNNNGDELLNIVFQREQVENSTEFYVNVIGPNGDVGTVLTLFDLPT